MTKNFNIKEFTCKDGTPVPEEYYGNVNFLALQLQVIRDVINRPITITSGYRTSKYNAKVGGKKHSKHLIALASDIQTSMSPHDLHAIILNLQKEGLIHKGGLHCYKTFVHYDCRGVNARW